MVAGLEIRPLAPGEIAAALDELAALRIAVFRAYPYLYEGSAEYERTYLRAYAESPEATVVLVRDGDRAVGAATAAPMEDHADAFAAPLLAAGHRLEEIYYCGESVLLPDYRGRGIGHVFFDQREARARALGRRFSAFCAVVRPPDHPARPLDHRPLDPFWEARGYRRMPEISARFSWREVGAAEESEKSMQFWIKAL